MTVKTYCVCGDEIRRKYFRGSGTPSSGKNSLNVRVSLVSRLIEEHESRVHLCRKCRAEFANRRSDANKIEKQKSGRKRLCDFCSKQIGSSIRDALKGPLGSVKSWSGKKKSGADDPYEKLDVCVECQRSFINFVERKKDSSN